jgi:hypothetical protein
MPPRSQLQQPDLLATLSVAQDRVVSRHQLAHLGYNSDAVSRRVAAKRWQTAGLTIVLHDAEISDRQRRWVAVLTAPGPALISGRAAAARFGLRGFNFAAIDVLVPINARPVHVDGVTWRRCRNVADIAVARASGPATVVPARSIIDAATWTTQPRTACALVAAAVQQRVVPVQNLRMQMALSTEIRHHSILTSILADIEGGADSLSEIDFTVLARKAGLPPPIRQSIRLDSDGRRRYLDADFDTFVAEVDGGVHLDAQRYWDDAYRQNEIVLGGDRVLRFSTMAIRLDEKAVLAQLRRAKVVFG